MMNINLGSMAPAFLIAKTRSIKTKMAITKSIYNGYIIHPPFCNKLNNEILSSATCNKKSIALNL